MQSSTTDFEHSGTYNRYLVGRLNNVYLEKGYLLDLMDELVSEFPDALHQITIGTTALNNPIYGYVLGLNLNSSDPVADAKARPSMLITGGHHARELTTNTMSVYTIMRLLFEFVQYDLQTIYLLQNTAIVVVPVLNYDGFEAISDHYISTSQMYWIRKNRNQYSN